MVVVVVVVVAGSLGPDDNGPYKATFACLYASASVCTFVIVYRMP